MRGLLIAASKNGIQIYDRKSNSHIHNSVGSKLRIALAMYSFSKEIEKRAEYVNIVEACSLK